VNGFNPQQLVKRGVFDSIEQADAVLCDWETARSRASITPDSWRRGMALDVPISRRLVASGSVAGRSYPLQDGLPAAECSPTHQQAITCGSVDSICPWCVIERAAQGQGAAPRTGFVAVARCGRHSAESSALLAPTSPTPPGAGHALSHATASGFPSNPNPNAGVVQAFPKGRWS
jgi:hypothetical protein